MGRPLGGGLFLGRGVGSFTGGMKLFEIVSVSFYATPDETGFPQSAPVISELIRYS